MSNHIYCSYCERQSKINTLLIETENGIEFIDEYTDNNWIIRDNCKINYMMKINSEYYCYNCMYLYLQEDIDSECSICLSGIRKNDIYTTPCCKHTFHKECITTWFFGHPSCPLCRSEINTLSYPEMIRV